MVEELKLAIKVDDDAIEQSLLKQFANAEKMANKVVLTFNNIDLDDKAIEAKFKEMQKMAGKNPIDLSIDKSSIEMLSAISKQLGNIFDIAKGKSIIDSSATVADVNKITNAINGLNSSLSKSNTSALQEEEKQIQKNIDSIKKLLDLKYEVKNINKSSYSGNGNVDWIGIYKSQEEAISSDLSDRKEKLHSSLNLILSEDKNALSSLEEEATKLKTALQSVQEMSNRISSNSSISDLDKNKGSEEWYKSYAEAYKAIDDRLGELNNQYRLTNEELEEYITLQVKAEKIMDRMISHSGGVQGSGAKNKTELKSWIEKSFATDLGLNQEDIYRGLFGNITDALYDGNGISLFDSEGVKRSLREISAEILNYKSTISGFSGSFGANEDAEKLREINSILNYIKNNASEIESTDFSSQIKKASELVDYYSQKLSEGEHTDYYSKSLKDAQNDLQNLISLQERLNATKDKQTNEITTEQQSSSLVEQQNKIQEELKETQKQAEQTSEALSNITDGNKSNISSGTQLEDVFQGDANVNTDASTTAIKEESQALDQVSTSAKDAATSKEKFANANKEVKASADNSKTSISEEEKYFNSLGKSLTQYQNTLTSISRKPADGNRSQELQEKIDIISSSLKKLNALKSKTEENGYIFNKNDVDTGKQLEKTIKENIELVKQMSAAQKGSDALSRGKEIDTITKYLNKFTGISKEAKQELNVLLDQLRSGDPSVNVKKIHERFLELTVAERNAGREARNLFDIFKDKKIYSFLGQAASMFSFYDLINYGREGISTLKEFDDGLTKISYTMDMTKSKLNDLGKSVLEMANDLDSSIDNAMQVSQIYANMNTSAEEIKKLSEPTLILSNLTGFDASTVADDIQAVTQQFEIVAEDSMHIADVYDQISRNISVDYGKGIESIAEAVQVAGSTANQAGLSFEQLAAIVGKTAEKTRLDGSQIGNGLKTIMTRLSKVGELSDEVDPETLSDASESLHKIGIEVYNADGSFRKFDVIMGELANKWDTLSDAEKSNISFSIAATRQTNLLSSILSNFSDSMSMAEEATNANGNALENNQKWVDSFSGRLQALENTAKSAWINILDSETLATGIDLLNGLLKVSTEIINTFGALPTVLTTGGIGAFIANFTWPSMATNNYNLSYSF